MEEYIYIYISKNRYHTRRNVVLSVYTLKLKEEEKEKERNEGKEKDEKL